MKNKLLIITLSTISFLTIQSNLNAQFYTYGHDPASQQWRQIRTDHFRLIYPVTWEDKAQELAHFMEAIRKPLSTSLNSNPKLTPVILRNQTMLSNGFVTWAPKRIEMVTTIPSNNQAVDWMRYLAVHEYRHVVQVEAVNRSTTGFFSKIFGEAVTGSVAGLHLPLWFLEGDAVLAETSFTRSGRGHLPSFMMPLKAQLLEHGSYSYDKAILGSYRDMVPDHYTLGYHLVASLQNKHGFEPFRSATRQVAKTPFFPGSFSRGIQKVNGKNLAGNYYAVVEELKTQWAETEKYASVSDYQIIKPDNSLDYVNYINPQYIDDDTFIAFRTTPADIPRLVKIGRDGSEEILFTPGFGYEITMSYANGLAAWLEINPDPRWGYRNWTNIRIFDLKTGKSHLITKRARLQAPILSPDGSRIVAVEVDATNRWALVIFDAGTGAELHRISSPDIDFIMEPDWTDCQNAIIAIAYVEGKGKSIVKTHIENPHFEHLFHTGFTDISEPAIHDCVIYFTGTWSGRDELYAWDIEEKQLYRVLASRFGATCAGFSEDGKRILFSDYTSTGYQIGEATTDKLVAVEIDKIGSQTPELYASAAREAYLLADTISVKSNRYQSSTFHKFPNLFHFHSWFPVALDVNGMSSNPGITAFSQNLLGTTVIGLGYEYDTENKGHKAFVDVSYKALYPVFDLRAEKGAEDRFYRSGDSIVNLRTSVSIISGGVGLPLSFNHNALIYGFIPRLSTSQEWYSFNFRDSIYTRANRSLTYMFSGYAYQRMAFRDLFPALGVSAAVGFRHTPFRNTQAFNDINAGRITYGIVSVFLPGIMKHHSFRLYAGGQHKVYGQTYFGDAIRHARGYQALPNHELALLSASYSFPLWYPDVALGSFIYSKRLKTNFFFDHSRSVFNEKLTTLNSFGIDMLLDAHLLRMPMPFEFGLRTLYLENERKLRFEFLWGVDFYAVGQGLKAVRDFIPTYKF